MRKVLTVCAALFLVVLCAVPAFAYGVDPDPETPIQYGYAPLMFSEVSDGTGSYTWPFNSSVYGTYAEEIEIAQRMFGTISFDGLPGVVTGSFNLPRAGGTAGDGNTYTLTLSHYQSQLVKMLELDNFVLSAREGVRVVSVDVSFFIVLPTLGNSLTDAERQTWQLTSYSASSTFYADAQGVMNVGTWVRSMIVDHPQNRTGNVSMIQNLSLNINFQRISVSTPGFNVSYTALEADPITLIGDWSRSQQMFRDVEYINPDYDFLSWLFSSVDGFLDLTIAPGISFRAVLYAVLAIGVLVAFLAIMG